MMSRLSYEQAIDDYENKKSNSLLESYKKHYKIMSVWIVYDPQGDLDKLFMMKIIARRVQYEQR